MRPSRPLRLILALQHNIAQLREDLGQVEQCPAVAVGKAAGRDVREVHVDDVLRDGLKQHLVDTHPKLIVCVDIDPWLGMQAAGGISAGQNGMGRALVAMRDELMAATDPS